MCKIVNMKLVTKLIRILVWLVSSNKAENKTNERQICKRITVQEWSGMVWKSRSLDIEEHYKRNCFYNLHF